MTKKQGIIYVILFLFAACTIIKIVDSEDVTIETKDSHRLEIKKDTIKKLNL